MRPSRAVPLLVLALSVAAAPPRPAAAAPDERRPAAVMSWRGADWLERAGREEEQRPDEIIRTMGLKDGDVVADFGCGTGYFARRMARAVAPRGRVYAVDVQPEMLELLGRRVEQEKITNVVPVTVPRYCCIISSGSVGNALIVGAREKPSSVPLISPSTGSLISTFFVPATTLSIARVPFVERATR